MWKKKELKQINQMIDNNFKYKLCVLTDKCRRKESKKKTFNFLVFVNRPLFPKKNYYYIRRMYG